MKITMITVVHNRCLTIGDAIDSVAKQVNASFEHLVVDGASTDGTLLQIESRRHASLRLLSEPDDGIYDALNKGLAMATGDVVGVVHSDDVLAHDQVLAQVAACFADPEVDAVYGDLQYVSASDPARIVRHWRAGAFDPGKLRRGWMPPHPALFVRRSVMDNHGGYDTHYRIAADYDAILRWFGRGGIRATYIPEVLVKMRLGGESNRSFGRIVLKSREDFRALRSNSVGGLAALVLKNLRKIPQFFIR